MVIIAINQVKLHHEPFHLRTNHVEHEEVAIKQIWGQLGKSKDRCSQNFERYVPMIEISSEFADICMKVAPAFWSTFLPF